MLATRRAALLGLIALALLMPTAQEPSARAAVAPLRPGSATPPAQTTGIPEGEPLFLRGTLDADVGWATSLAFGPDGRLYVASQTGIKALTLDAATQEVLAVEQVASGLVDVMGIAFDPTAPASPVTFYASRQDPSATGGFQGVVSRFTAPTWDREDVITGLPTSRPFLNHLTNGLAFDDQGVLYIAQGSSTNAGLAGPYWPETPLSAAILVADIHAPGFDGAITHDPPGPPEDDTVDQASGFDVGVYAPGLRNPYDLVVHSNGYIYATDNGPMRSPVSISCTESADLASAADELNLIEEGNYYGHPNRNRGRLDPRQCAYHPAEQGGGGDFTRPIAVLPDHCSCDGIAEYTGTAFGGAMLGDLVYAEWFWGNVSRAELSQDGRSVLSLSELAGGFLTPLDVTVGPDGTIYVAEYGGNAVSYLMPITDPTADWDEDGCTDKEELGPDPNLGGQRNPSDFWDYADMPDPNATPQRDRRVRISDVVRVLNRYGTDDEGGAAPINRNTDPLSTPLKTGYHPAYDRGQVMVGQNPWNVEPPDGLIRIGDVVYVLNQYGHDCAGPPP